MLDIWAYKKYENAYGDDVKFVGSIIDEETAQCLAEQHPTKIYFFAELEPKTGRRHNWIPTSHMLPEDGTDCIIIGPGGDERELHFDRMWLLPDRSMYVYFTPVFWRPKKEN